ncbi:FeoA domain-containing protein [Muricauda sp. 334s03]|uniref:FeoA domain-containing protein n=1 Tax=Flagellimonas yonaguniensis TaxID=3031325 RepID=A0ABT5XTP9_9FLAO|nr:metal-dependent transcriptional regulator [[Muricauda] yonaguniensis]MDF0714558.1 FeoA domain-containing protein [[Muricauda] yonaguniensis]
MEHPILALGLGLLVIVVLAWAFWPKKGLFARMGKVRNSSRRVLLEDTLKYLFDCEYKGNTCDLNSVAGNLNISADQMARLLAHLRDMGLVVFQEQNIRLTDTGKSYALRIVRVHRIWERFLADETGVEQMDWHGEADIREHQLSMEDANRIAARIGNPAFDPHGDPIPTKDGKIPPFSGKTLNSLKEGEVAQIVHIEDEPHYIFEQLSAQGLYPGMQVYLLDVQEGKVTFAADGNECVLTPLFASAITVQPLPKAKPIQEGYQTLSDLEVDETATVVGISSYCRGLQRRRLMDFGIVPGNTITAEIQSASGDPVGYRILGTTIAIRKNQADLIFINNIKKEHHEQSA